MQTWAASNGQAWEVLSATEVVTPGGPVSAMVLREIVSGTPENLLKFAVGMEGKNPKDPTHTMKKVVPMASEQAARDMIAKQAK